MSTVKEDKLAAPFINAAKLNEVQGSFAEQVHTAAIVYIESGLRVVPIRPNEKILLARKHGADYSSASRDRATIDEWFDPKTGKFKGYNIAIATGVEGGAFVIDIDNKNDKDGFASLDQLASTGCELSSGPTASTPNGGEHRLYLWQDGLGNTVDKLGEGLDTRGGVSDACKGHIVVWPSKVNGGQYKWTLGGDLLLADQWVIDAIARPPGQSSSRNSTSGGTKTGERGNEEIADGDVGQQIKIEQVTEMLQSIDPNGLSYDDWLHVGMAINSQHPSDEGLKVWELWSKRGGRYKPGECTTRWHTFTSGGEVRMGTLFHHAKAGGWVDSILGSAPGKGLQLNLEKLKLSLNKDGNVTRTLINCLILMGKLPNLELKLNTFSTLLYCNKEEINDVHYTEIRIEIENAFGIPFSKDAVVDAIGAIARHCQYDALMDYVKGLPDWDGIDRIEELNELLQVPHNIQRVFIRKHLIAHIARALEPGCKVDTAVIFFGHQGAGKSSFVEQLMPDSEWFDDTISGRLSDKDELAKTCGKWAIELPELASLNKTNREEAKQYLTIKKDRYRPPYGRNTVEFKRRFCIWGTTNDERHLSDTTGNRRYWPVSATDHAKATRWLKDGARDQLWAQALALYQRGEQWWLTEAEEEDQKIIAELHRKRSADEQYLEQWWENKTHCFIDKEDVCFIQASIVQDALADVLNYRPSPHQAADALRLIGFVAHPQLTAEDRMAGKVKATSYRRRTKGKIITAPKGFASPGLSAKCVTLPKGERCDLIMSAIDKEKF